MLRRQRTFFLTENQYESVILEYVGLNSGRQVYQFNKEEPDVNGYTIWARISSDAGLHWGEWYSNALTITNNPAVFTFPFIQGSMCEVYVVVTGDGAKDPSNPSNIITAITPAEPSYTPPVIEAYPFYTDGTLYPAVITNEFPSGVSSYVLWAREFGSFDWSVCAWVNDGRIGILTQSLVEFESGKQYQFIAAWWDRTVGKLISDISNITMVSLPSAGTTKLVPPKRVTAYFYGEYQGRYLNTLVVSRGDMRATSVMVEYKRSTVGGDWAQAFEFVFSEHDITDSTRLYYISPAFSQSETPITGEVWQYRLRNKANGYIISDYSDIFVITIPSFLPKLDTPMINLAQNGESVVVSWDSVSNASGYKIERRLNSVSTFTALANVPATNSRYEDYGTSFGNTYVYRVTALGDNQSYQDSSPAQASITLTNIVVLDAPVIDSVVESGIDIVATISNIDAPNTSNVKLEMSENGGSWVHVGYSGVPPLSATSVTITVDGTKVNGGTLRFRAKALPAAMAQEDSPYSSISTLTIAEREWLLKWNGTTWDYCTSITGGWSSPTIRFSDGDVAGNVQVVDLGNGTLRLQGTGYFMTGAMSEGRSGLNSKYTRICMLGNLIKQVDGTDNHAWFGNGHTYSFSGGTSIQHGNYTFAGGESGRASAGTKANPYVNAIGQGTYATSTGARVYFRLYNGYADIKGIYAIKR